MTAAVFATKLCMDDGSGCSELVPEFDSVHQGDKGPIGSREVTEHDKKCIHRALKLSCLCRLKLKYLRLITLV